jgi:acyl carrier protein
VDPETSPPSAKLRELLRGFPAPTVEACAEFQSTHSNDAFERAFAGIIERHLRQPPAQPVAQMPGSTRLVADLGLDSLTMVEMAFLFEDLFATKLPHEDFVKIVTLDDLRGLLRSKIPGLQQA